MSAPIRIACQEAFESRRTPNLDLKRNADGSYRYQATQLAFRDFADGWNARYRQEPTPEVVQIVKLAICEASGLNLGQKVAQAAVKAMREAGE